MSSIEDGISIFLTSITKNVDYSSLSKKNRYKSYL